MKNLKAIILSSMLAISLVVPTVGVHAAQTSKLATAITNQQAKLAANQQIKADLAQKKDIIKQNHQSNVAIKAQIATKKNTIKSIQADIVKNHKQLTSEDLANLQAQLTVVQADVSALENTRDTAKQALAQVKADIQNKDYTAAMTGLDNIISIQNTRTSALNKLSADLDTTLSLLQTAAANATVPIT